MQCCSTDQPTPILGLVLVALGVVLALNQFGLIDTATLLAFWPAILIVIGARMMAKGLRGRRRRDGNGTPWTPGREARFP